MTRIFLCLLLTSTSIYARKLDSSQALGAAFGANQLGLSYEKWTRNTAHQFSVIPNYQEHEKNMELLLMVGYKFKQSLGVGENWQGLFGTAQTRNYWYAGLSQWYFQDEIYDEQIFDSKSLSSVSLLSVGYGLDHQYEFFRWSMGLGYSAIYNFGTTTYNTPPISSRSQNNKTNLFILTPSVESSLSFAWGGANTPSRGKFELDKGYWQNSHAFGVVLASAYHLGLSYTYWAKEYGLTLAGLPIYDKSWENSDDEVPLHFVSLTAHKSLMDDSLQKSFFGFSNNHFFGSWGISYMRYTKILTHLTEHNYSSHLGLEFDKEYGATRIGLQLGYHLKYTDKGIYQEWSNYPYIGARFEFVLRKKQTYE